MNITPQNWMSLVAHAVELLPADMKATLRVEPEVLDPTRCPDCGDTKVFLSTATPTCASCNVNDLQHFTPVELSVARPRVSIKMNDHVLGSAVLVRLPERVEVVIPEAPGATFRVNSPSPKNSAGALQQRIRELVVEKLASARGDDPSTAGAADRRAIAMPTNSRSNPSAAHDGATPPTPTWGESLPAPGVKAGRKDVTMKITIHNWKSLIEGALDLLPTELRQQLIVNTSAVGPAKCESCGETWLFPEIDGPWCRCSNHLQTINAIDCSLAHPRVLVEHQGEPIAAAVLVRGKKLTELLVPGLYFRKFRIGSVKPENSAEGLQKAIRALVYPRFGLSTDAHGFWGWANGDRLEGGEMVPTVDQLLDKMMDQDEQARAGVGTNPDTINPSAGCTT